MDTDFFDDSDDDILSEVAEQYEKTAEESNKKTKDDDKTNVQLTPLEQFRPGYLWVSDLTRQNWCEQQLYYTFTVPTIQVENPVMTEGSNLHLARELAVHDVVKVKVTSSEDIWAIKVLNIIMSIQGFLNNTTLAREVPIFGAPFGEDVFIVGLIDELRFDPESYQIDLQELKTRKYKSFPSKAQQNQHRLQVMIYKKLFDDLVKGKVTKETVSKHLKLDMCKEFGIEIQAHIDSSCLSSKTLNELMDLLFEKMQCMTCISQIGIEYVHQDSKQTLYNHTVKYNDSELESLYKGYLRFWRGQRSPEGVDIEEAGKCQSCDFGDICDWRKRKADEYSAKNKPENKM